MIRYMYKYVRSFSGIYSLQSDYQFGSFWPLQVTMCNSLLTLAVRSPPGYNESISMTSCT